MASKDPAPSLFPNKEWQHSMISESSRCFEHFSPLHINDPICRPPQNPMQYNKLQFLFYFNAYVFIFTCAALNGSHCSGRRPWWRRRKYEQWPPSFSLFFSSTALVDCPHIAVASHPKGSWHWKSVHVVHGPSHGLRLHLTVDLLNLPIYLHLTQLVDKKKLENREKIKGFNPIWRTFIIIISDLHVWCLFY